MKFRSIIECLVLLSLSIGSLLITNYAAAANDDFSLRLTLNGDDISEIDTIVIDPERELKIELQISDVTRNVTLKNVLIVLTFA